MSDGDERVMRAANVTLVVIMVAAGSMTVILFATVLLNTWLITSTLDPRAVDVCIAACGANGVERVTSAECQCVTVEWSEAGDDR
jgi:hypothetical protein